MTAEEIIADERYHTCGRCKHDEQNLRMKQASVLDKIRAEIEEIEINGHIKDVECFSAGINAALNVIDKYMGEREEAWN